MIEYKPPEINKLINKIEYKFSNMDLLISAEKLDSDTSAELWFYHQNGTGKHLLKVAKVNLLADRTMKSLATSLKDNSEDIPWPQVLTSIIKNTLEYQRYGDPGGLIQPTTHDIKHPGYYLEPVIIKGLPTIIFGNKGVNKTNLCLLMLGIVYLGLEDNSTSGLISHEPAKIGMLDWESSQEMTYYNVSRMIEGGSVPYFELPYLRCRRKLIDEIDRIVEWKNKHGVELLLIDSLGQAAGSERFDTSGKEAALKFFEALNQLNVTSLTIAQNAKSETGDKTIYGSTYFTYYARNIFELVDTNSSNNKEEKIIALKHIESNYSGKYDPIGFKISYTEKSIIVESQKVSLAQIRGKMNDSESILAYMRDESRLVSIDEVVKAIGKSADRVRVVLSQLKDNKLVANPQRGLWGILSEEKD